MTRCVAGEASEIELRLAREGRNIELVELQFVSPASIHGTAGWWPSPRADFFPVVPEIGDTIILRSYYADDGQERGAASSRKVGQKFWRVTERSILQSGPTATKMSGIVVLLVERVDGFWRRSIEEQGEEENA